MIDSWEPPEDEATQAPKSVSAEEEEKGEIEWVRIKVFNRCGHIKHYNNFQKGNFQADTVSETATSVADETDVSVAFSEQGDSATVSVNEDAKSTGQTSIESTSAEALDEKVSNVNV